MKQTAVDWIKDMLEWNYGNTKMLEITWENLDDLLERAKQMEKEQIKESFIVGNSAKGLRFDSEKYYNQTYLEI